MIQSNRHLYDHFQKKGNEFIYSCNLSYYPDQQQDENTNSKNVPFPLFAPNMFESFYNEITNNLGNTIPPPANANGIQVGFATYGGNIWDAFAQFNFGAVNHTTFYPYNGPDVTGSPFFSNDFFVKIASGSVLNGNETMLSGYLKISSQKMAYLNFMRTLQTKKVHCSKINFQWNQFSTTNNECQFRNNPIVFFDQKIDGTITTNETTLNHHFKPSYYGGQENMLNGWKAYYYNIDVPCDWIFSASSGVSIGWDCLNMFWFQPPINDLTLNFYLQEIK